MIFTSQEFCTPCTVRTLVDQTWYTGVHTTHVAAVAGIISF